MRVAYLVSRFPLASETFILRELNAIDGRDGIEVELHALFAPARPFAHPDARRWLARVRRPSPWQSLRALAWWTLRRPRELARCALTLAGAYRLRIGRLARALATLALAAAHARAMRAEEIDHVHAHFATYPAIAAWVCFHLTGTPYSITAHAHDIFVDRSMLAVLVGDARFVTTISEFNRELLAPYAGESHTPLHVVRCGVAPGAYGFRPRGVPPQGPIRALCVASLEEYKGHRVLLDALARGEGLARVQLDLVGAGSLESALRAQIAQLGVDGRVRLLGMRSEEQVAELLDRADLFVLPSVVARDGQMEGIPVALMEALAAGVPTVATRLSGIPELVQDGITGLLAEPGDWQDLSRALRLTIEGERATRARTIAGRALIEREFDVRRSAQTLCSLFLQAASGRHSSNAGRGPSAAVREPGSSAAALNA